MLGQLKFSDGQWGATRRETVYGLEVLTARTDPEGWLGESRLRRRDGICAGMAWCALWAPARFDRWPLLERCGLRRWTPPDWCGPSVRCWRQRRCAAGVSRPTGHRAADRAAGGRDHGRAAAGCAARYAIW